MPEQPPANSETQLQANFRPTSGQLQASFRPASGQLQANFRIDATTQQRH
jgi:hypothetical protein